MTPTPRERLRRWAQTPRVQAMGELERLNACRDELGLRDVRCPKCGSLPAPRCPVCGGSGFVFVLGGDA